MAEFDRGDIVNLGPLGIGLVLSPASLNQLSDALVAPVVQGSVARYAGFAVSLAGCATPGVALVNKVQTLDLRALQAQRIEQASQEVVSDAIARLCAILQG